MEAQGYGQERYAALGREFKDWNDGVWNHQWQVTRNHPCALCGSLDPGITVKGENVCLPCLNEYPNTPWHPTGGVRPKARDLLAHLQTCKSPSIHGMKSDSNSSTD